MMMCACFQLGDFFIDCDFCGVDIAPMVELGLRQSLLELYDALYNTVQTHI